VARTNLKRIAVRKSRLQQPENSKKLDRRRCARTSPGSSEAPICATINATPGTFSKGAMSDQQDKLHKRATAKTEFM